VLAEYGNAGNITPSNVKNEGFAEVIKYGVIEQPDLLDTLAQTQSFRSRSTDRGLCLDQARIVAKDERENSGERALLNFGHTIGHGIEAVAGYGTMLHGEAHQSWHEGSALAFHPEGGASAERFTEESYLLLKQFGLPTVLPNIFFTEAIIEKVFIDKKFRPGGDTLRAGFWFRCGLRFGQNYQKRSCNGG